MKKILASVALAAILTTACNSTKSGQDAYADFKENRPEAAFVVTQDAKVDQVGQETALLYKDVITMLDDYIKGTSGHRDFVAFQNETREMTEKEVTDFFKTLTPEQQKNISAAAKNESLTANISTAGTLVTRAAKLSKSTSGLASAFSGFDMATMKKISSAKNIANQAQFSLKAAEFMLKEYQTVQRLKSYSGR